MAKVIGGQIRQIQKRIHDLVEAVGELSLQADKKFGKDSKQARAIQNILTLVLEVAYGANV